MAKKLISIIIPLYNSLPYFERTIESLMSQTLDASLFEVIIVDDGSNDGSERYADKAALQRPDIFKVLHEPPSGGPSRPRNIAIAEAAGDYLFFLDADDFLGDEALERMANHVDEWNSDILIVKQAGENNRDVPKSMFRHSQPNADIWKSRAFNTLSPRKLFRTDLVRENNLSFPEWTKHREDYVFVAQALFLAETISIASDYDYCHLVFRQDCGNLTSETYMDFESDYNVTRLMLEAMDAALPEPDAGSAIVLPRTLKSSWFAAAYAASRSDDAFARNKMYEELKALIAHRMSTEAIKKQLAPGLGDLVLLILEGRYDLATECIEMIEVNPTSEFKGVDLARCTTIKDGGSLFALSSRGNIRIDCTRQIPVNYSIDKIHTGRSIEIACVYEKNDYWGDSADISLVLSFRGSDAEKTVRAKRKEKVGDVRIRFTFKLGIVDCLKLAEPGEGIWDCYLRFEQDGLLRQIRFGSTLSSDCREQLEKTPTVWHLHGRRLRAHLTPVGNLSLRVAPMGK